MAHEIVNHSKDEGQRSARYGGLRPVHFAASVQSQHGIGKCRASHDFIIVVREGEGGLCGWRLLYQLFNQYAYFWQKRNVVVTGDRSSLQSLSGIGERGNSWCGKYAIHR